MPCDVRNNAVKVNLQHHHVDFKGHRLKTHLSFPIFCNHSRKSLNSKFLLFDRALVTFEVRNVMGRSEVGFSGLLLDLVAKNKEMVLF